MVKIERISKLLLTTNNQAKIRKYKSLPSNLSGELVTPGELGITTIVSEIGESLEENARLKVIDLVTESQLAAFADDSGYQISHRGQAARKISEVLEKLQGYNG